MPRKFHFDWRAIGVVEIIIDQWFGYCKLKGGDGALYIYGSTRTGTSGASLCSQARKRRRSPRTPAPACIRTRQGSLIDAAMHDLRRQGLSRTLVRLGAGYADRKHHIRHHHD